jgi:hypothetical protein
VPYRLLERCLQLAFPIQEVVPAHLLLIAVSGNLQRLDTVEISGGVASIAQNPSQLSIGHCKGIDTRTYRVHSLCPHSSRGNAF